MSEDNKEPLRRIDPGRPKDCTSAALLDSHHSMHSYVLASHNLIANAEAADKWTWVAWLATFGQACPEPRYDMRSKKVLGPWIL